MKIVVDTSTVVDHLRAGKGSLKIALERARRKRAVVYIPTIVISEIWRGVSMKDKSVRKDVSRLLKGMKVIDLTKQIAKKSGELVREGEMLEIEDAIVAASALYIGAQLATSNIKHFSDVEELKLFQPHIK